MQTILDRRAPTTIVVDSGTDDSDGYDSEEDELPEHVNANYETAVQEFDTFQTFKLQRYHPEVIPKKEGFYSCVVRFVTFCELFY